MIDGVTADEDGTEVWLNGQCMFSLPPELQEQMLAEANKRGITYEQAITYAVADFLLDNETS